MYKNEPLERLLEGLIMIGVGALLFIYTLKQTREDSGISFRAQFGLFASCFSFLMLGVVFIYIGIKGLFQTNN